MVNLVVNRVVSLWEIRLANRLARLPDSLVNNLLDNHRYHLQDNPAVSHPINLLHNQVLNLLTSRAGNLQDNRQESLLDNLLVSLLVHRLVFLVVVL